MEIVKRLRRAAAWPAAWLGWFAGVGPGRHGLGLAALAAKYFADVDWLVAMRAFVGCHLALFASFSARAIASSSVSHSL